jgi:hypothetical protein
MMRELNKNKSYYRKYIFMLKGEINVAGLRAITDTFVCVSRVPQLPSRVGFNSDSAQHNHETYVIFTVNH